MSTYYKRFRAPITSVRLIDGPGHDHVRVFERGRLAGDLTVTKGSGRDVALLFAGEEVIQVTCGADRTLVRTNLKPTDPEEWVIDDCGTHICRAQDVLLASSYSDRWGKADKL